MKKEETNKRQTLASDEPLWVTTFYDGLIDKTDKQTSNKFRSRNAIMKDVYREIEEKLKEFNSPSVRAHGIESRIEGYASASFPAGIAVMWAIMNSVALYDDPAAPWPQRKILASLVDVENDIKKNTVKLIKLLNRRDELQTKGVIICNSDLDLASIITKGLTNKAASEIEINDFLICVDKKWRVFPSLQDVLAVVIEEINIKKPAAFDPADAAVLSKSRKASPVDICRRIEESLKELKRIRLLPDLFSLSRSAQVKIIDCATGKCLEESSISHALSKKVNIQRKKYK